MAHIKESSFLFMELIHNFPYSEISSLVKDLLNYIDTHIYERITINDLAQSVQKHPTHINSQFKNALGQTVHTYINQKKNSRSQVSFAFHRQKL
ncbi:hypothetical protein [Enterococcus asini]|uniref:hypothetical protein n=1 Tax=Enterococcus asini TaxID=57732 RepID=UPI0022E351F4|nr:hypothetical protein [Enterococcus asini]